MDLALGSTKPYGSSRSIVRRIASYLPIKPCRRVHFQLYPYSEDASVFTSTRRYNGSVTSLADVSWVDKEEEDDKDYYDKPKSRNQPGLLFRTQLLHSNQKGHVRWRSLPSLHQGAPDPQGPMFGNNEAIQKINALETELAKLSAQIAQLVIAQEKKAQSAANIGGPPAAISLPPPPPPPPPPLPLHRTFSAIDLIKARRGKKTGCPTVEQSRPSELPNMLEILKDINKVKLRSVKSRPVEDDTKAKSKDPAALIADALKRKFAHRNNEQSDIEDFNSPVQRVKPQPKSPLFGQHMLKSTGRRKLL